MTGENKHILAQSVELQCQDCHHTQTVDLFDSQMHFNKDGGCLLLGLGWVKCSECGSKKLVPTIFFKDRRQAS